jgi:hypothetical protein
MKSISEKDRAYLLENYGINFPARAQYIRQSNKVYSIMDFNDGEKVSFAWMCEKPSSNAAGYATYYSPRNGFRLINIEELKLIE